MLRCKMQHVRKRREGNCHPGGRQGSPGGSASFMTYTLLVVGIWYFLQPCNTLSVCPPRSSQTPGSILALQSSLLIHTFSYSFNKHMLYANIVSAHSFPNTKPFEVQTVSRDRWGCRSHFCRFCLHRLPALPSLLAIIQFCFLWCPIAFSSSKAFIATLC